MGLLRGAVAHDVVLNPRTMDVMLAESTTFSDLMLSTHTLSGLDAAGFHSPSPIQRSAIPLGRCGNDLIVQAKSGTGKTLVFGILALEMLDISIPQLQVLILAPTREIAVQIKEVLISISSALKGLKVASFIGGMSVSADMEAAASCHVAVGTLGRMKQLVGNGTIRLRSVRLFVLDEADKLMESSFKNDVNFIFSRLPENKQTVVVSATFPPEMESYLTKYLVHPRRVCPSADTLLLGLEQFVAVINDHTSAFVRVRDKTQSLLTILSSLSFRQCLVFCNIQSRMEGICKELASLGWPALTLAGSMPQSQRLAVVAALQNQRCRVLLTTDLAARGVDAEQVDLVVNLDLPYDTETYLHRIGRAGRFGAAGVAITVVHHGKELTQFRHILFDVGGSSYHVRKLPTGQLTPDVWKDDALETLQSLERSEKKCKESGSSEKMKSEEVKIISTPVDEERCKEVIRNHIFSLPKNIPEVSYETFLKRFRSKELNFPELECLNDFPRKPVDAEGLATALKALKITDSLCNELTNEVNENLKNEMDKCDLNENESLNDEFESEFEVSEEEYESELEEDFDDEYLGTEESEYDSVNEDNCTVCASWFNEWKEQLVSQRNALQNQLYWQEMLK